MRKTFIVLTAGIMGLASTAFAQTAMEQALAQKLCGDAEPLSAEFIENGAKIQATCPPGTAAAGVSGAAIPTVLAGTAAGGGGVAGALLGVIVIGAVLGGGSDGSTTTTTTTGGS